MKEIKVEDCINGKNYMIVLLTGQVKYCLCKYYYHDKENYSMEFYNPDGSFETVSYGVYNVFLFD